MIQLMIYLKAQESLRHFIFIIEKKTMDIKYIITEVKS